MLQSQASAQSSSRILVRAMKPGPCTQSSKFQFQYLTFLFRKFCRLGIFHAQLASLSNTRTKHSHHRILSVTACKMVKLSLFVLVALGCLHACAAVSRWTAFYHDSTKTYTVKAGYWKQGVAWAYWSDEVERTCSFVVRSLVSMRRNMRFSLLCGARTSAHYLIVRELMFVCSFSFRDRLGSPRRADERRL